MPKRRTHQAIYLLQICMFSVSHGNKRLFAVDGRRQFRSVDIDQLIWFWVYGKMTNVKAVSAAGVLFKTAFV